MVAKLKEFCIDLDAKGLWLFEIPDSSPMIKFWICHPGKYLWFFYLFILESLTYMYSFFLHLRLDSQPRKRGWCDSPTSSHKASMSLLVPVARTSSPLPVASMSSLPSTKHRHKQICDINIDEGLTVKDLCPNVLKLYAEAREHIKSHIITEDPYASVYSRFDVAKNGYTIIMRPIVPEPDMMSGM